MTENKKARLERCRWLIERQRHDELFSAADLANFNCWTGNNYIAAKRTRNPTFPGAKYYVQAKRQDGTWGGTSWKQDIDQPSPEQLVKRAMRVEVKPHMERFLFTAIQVCTHCGTTHKPTVDHKDKSFNSIANEFIAKYGPVSVVNNPARGAPDIMGDRAQATLWFTHHANEATYQILCRSCNSKKGENP